jgi:NADPH-dependent curcumin reductase CurA
VGFPKESDFRLVEAAVPEPGAGQFLARAVYLSLDPYMRGRMSDARSYVPPVALGEVMEGGVVGEVVASNHPRYAAGDVVEGRLGWREYAVSDGKGVRKIDRAAAPISAALGVLGMPGLTAYFGLLEVGQPKAGETVVVSAAAGAVGGLVGQIAKLMGCRAVGLAGTDAKVAYLTEALGYDVGINYRTTRDLDADLGAACPGGVDVYFDNVGGRITEAVSRHVNPFARFAVCGLISQYNLTEPEVAPRNERFVLVNRVRIQGFIVSDFAARYKEGLAQLTEWVRAGKLRYKEDVVDGLARAPAALIGLLQGQNFGKMLVRVGPDPAPASGPEPERREGAGERR